jgi:hypothetical protein
MTFKSLSDPTVTFQHPPEIAGLVPQLKALVYKGADTAGLAALKLQYGSGGAALFSDEFYPSEAAYIMLRDGRKDILTAGAINALVFGQKRTQ